MSNWGAKDYALIQRRKAGGYYMRKRNEYQQAIYELYFEVGLTQRAIAELAGTSFQNVTNLVWRHRYKKAYDD